MKKSNIKKQVMRDSSEITYQYPGNLQLSDLKGLKQINLQGKPQNAYLLFNEALIKDFDKANDRDRIIFKSLTVEPSYCRPGGASGLKYFKRKGGRPSCKIYVGDEVLKGEITHELKNHHGQGRILCYELASTNGGPSILVASHYEKNGLYNDSSRSLALTALPLPVSKQVTNNRYTLFKPTAEEKEEVAQTTPGPRLTKR